MFGTHRFENPYDPDDDGSDLEITTEEQAASDDEGRAEAATILGQLGAKETSQNDRNFHRWLVRLAKNALGEGATRRRIARKKEKVRAAAEAEAAGRREENARKAAKSKHAFERYCRESDALWAATWEQVRRDDAAWEADRPAREAAEQAAKANTPTSGMNAKCGVSRASALHLDSGRPPVAKVATPPEPKAPVVRTTQQPSSALGKPTGSAARPPVRTADTTTTRAPAGQPSRASGQTARLNPPPTLPAFAPPSWATATRTAPRSARPVPAAPAPPRPSIPRPRQVPEARTSALACSRVLPLAASQPLPPPPPPSAPTTAELPPFTGADLAAYRGSLGLSQGALAVRLGTTQGTVSKAEGTPTALLGPTLRRAMWDAQRNAGGPSR